MLYLKTGFIKNNHQESNNSWTLKKRKKIFFLFFPFSWFELKKVYICHALKHKFVYEKKHDYDYIKVKIYPNKDEIEKKE